MGPFFTDLRPILSSNSIQFNLFLFLYIHITPSCICFALILIQLIINLLYIITLLLLPACLLFSSLNCGYHLSTCNFTFRKRHYQLLFIILFINNYALFYTQQTLILFFHQYKVIGIAYRFFHIDIIRPFEVVSVT